MKYEDAKNRLDAALVLLNTTSTTKEKFDSICKLIYGINPDIDKKLQALTYAFANLEKIQTGAVIELSAEALPEYTVEDKKRKKALLLLIGLWKDLHSEVARVKAELKNNHGNLNVSSFAKLMTFAKGPLGIVTLVALGLVALNLVSVEVVIKNRGCDTIEPVAKIPFPIAGVKLPNEPIPNGGQATASLLPITIDVDNTTPENLKLSLFNLSYSFNLPASTSLTLDGTSLIGKRQTFSLQSRKSHELTISCL